MMMHSCSCMLFSCIVWFEITFQNNFNLHSKFGWKLEKKKKRLFFPPLPIWPVGPVPAPARLIPSARPAHSVRVARF